MALRHADIISQLTLAEKCALLQGATSFGTWPIERLGVPSMQFSDGPSGVRHQAGAADHLGLNASEHATCFPTAVTMANTWDEELEERVGGAMGQEAAVQGVGTLLGPGLCIKRNPLCGRNFEYFSEDPLLSGKMAAAFVRGVQSTGIAACPKHYAVNSQETRRQASDSVLDERTLREIYLTGFETCVREGAPKTIMSSYNLVNGTYANESATCSRTSSATSGALTAQWSRTGAAPTTTRPAWRRARPLRCRRRASARCASSWMPWQTAALSRRTSTPAWTRLLTSCSPWYQPWRPHPRALTRAPTTPSPARPRRPAACCSRTRATSCPCRRAPAWP